VRKKFTWTDTAKAQLRQIDQPTALRILKAIDRFLSTGEGDVKRMTDLQPPTLRLRVQDYRVLMHDHDNHLYIFAVGHRKDVYRH